MKHTFISDSCTGLINLEDEKVLEIYDKMAHITANFQRIQEVALEQARNHEEREIIIKELHIDEIQVDLDDADDEFYFLYNNEYINNICCHVEVVTPEIAESNDKEWLSDCHYTDEDRASYKLGEVMSDYSKLSEKYYFKFMWK